MPLGIKKRNLDTSLQVLLASDPPALQTGSSVQLPSAGQMIGKRPGLRATNALRLAANVADTETVVIGADTYEIETVATAIGGGAVAAGGTFNSTNDPKQITITAHGLVAGDLIACQTEICQILVVIDVNTVVVSRGRYGTTAATHADGQTINKGNGITAGRIPVGFIATFTPAVAGPALADAINNPKHGGVRPVAKSSTIFGSIEAFSLLSGADFVIAGIDPGVNVIACTETLAGANNAWANATMVGGLAATDRAHEIQTRVPTAGEVGVGQMDFAFPFTVRVGAAIVSVVVTATGLAKAWDGDLVIASANGRSIVTADNAGAVDWAATDTVRVIAYE